MRKDDSGQSQSTYIPALGFHRLTPLYDPLLRLVFPEQKVKRQIVDRVGDANTLLDLGCGTGTLVLMLQHANPVAQVIGIDVDRSILNTAQSKIQQGPAPWPALVQGSAISLPFEDSSLECVVTSFVIHHLTTENKLAAFRECFRILRPGCSLLVADIAPPRDTYARVVSLILHLLEDLDDNLHGRLPNLIAQAGFVQVATVAHVSSIVGSLSVYRAIRP